VDVAGFLGRYPPFDSMDADGLDGVAAVVEIEHFAPGVTILQQAGRPAEFLYVIRKGAVEILDDGNLIDLMGEGESFGAWSMLAGFGPTASVRAHEDTLCYLIPREVAFDLLGSGAGLAHVMSSLRRRLERVPEGPEDRSQPDRYRKVGTLVRRPLVTCEPGDTVSSAAALMARERVSCLLVSTGPGTWGILTDRDLRSRVIAERRGPDTPVAEVMTSPAVTVRSDVLAGEVLMYMLEDGYHHVPVAENGRVIGVVTDTDLMGLGLHTPFALKSAIERSRSRDEMVEIARTLPEVVAALVEASADPVDVGHVVGFAIDAMTRKLLDLGVDRFGDPPIPWAWLALGSAARQEQALHTDQDHALVYDQQDRSIEDVDPYFGDLAGFVTDGLEASGIPRCVDDAMAANGALRKSVDGWLAAFHEWMVEPGVHGSELLSIVFDYRRVAGPLDAETPLDGALRTAPSQPMFLRHLSHRALDRKPPTGFFRDLVVEGKGEHAGRLDVKHGGITIIGNLARAYAIGKGLTEKRTIARLEAAAAAGRIDEEARDELIEAFRFLWGVRLEHQVRRYRAGAPPDDFIDPAELGQVTRQGLKEAFRIIARAQKALATEIGVSLR
jgi:CBS domain-containing protein